MGHTHQARRCHALVRGQASADPWVAKALGVVVVAYALSPIDLIPDFIPVLGVVDDLLLLPGLIWLAVRLVPPDVLAQCRADADAWMRTEGRKPTSRAGAILVVLLWIAIGVAAWLWLRSRGGPSPV